MGWWFNSTWAYHRAGMIGIGIHHRLKPGGLFGAVGVRDPLPAPQAHAPSCARARGSLRHMSAFAFKIDKKLKIVRATIVDSKSDHRAFAIASFQQQRRGGPYDYMRVSLFVQGDRGRQGAMVLSLTRPAPGEMLAECEACYARLRPALFRASEPLYRVLSSDVRQPYQGSGYGVLQYATAIVLADLQGTGIAADECFIVKGYEGMTSEAAQRVWASRQLAKIANVRGFVAFLRH